MQHDFILLDRSGSMDSQWAEALSACNAYVKKLADDKVDTGVTMAVFDRDGGTFKFEVIRDRITPPTWRPVSNADATPRGMTPLNQATHEIVRLANAGNYDKVAIIIMTDGLENNSAPEFTVATAKQLLDDCRAKNWQVIFLGANFDNAAQAMSYGTAPRNTVMAAAGNFVAAMHTAAISRSAYGLTGAAMGYTDAEKLAAKTKVQP